MSPSQIYEPTYKAIKRLLMDGFLPAGSRLDTAKLASRLGVSTSPVRDCLNHLAGERMVDFTSGEGFQVPRLDSSRIEGLLDVNLALLQSAISDEPAYWAVMTTGEGTPADRAAILFHGIAFRTGNMELTAAVDAVGERLWAVRLLDHLVIRDPVAILDRLQAALGAREPSENIRELLNTYHAERKREAGEYARLLTERRA